MADNSTERRMLREQAKAAGITVPAGASNDEIRQLIAPVRRRTYEVLREGGRTQRQN
ncbi:hypothetical protein O7623_00885 [Solwaraspora sp. WMMD791]|uniref:hypothetical protein n=1 Tax=Solwaraspora sp. WMMD791 TaxID=3016086 RepID=UPI00249B5DFF|nr:hypothetical protein [Solwaraspora sp. WMMD791]WFE27801.1 hypothetical protein O7623_00885 [Solwaraspora sp. WMMD791]